MNRPRTLFLDSFILLLSPNHYMFRLFLFQPSSGGNNVIHAHGEKWRESKVHGNAHGRKTPKSLPENYGNSHK